MKPLLTIGQAAVRLGVAVDTLRRLERQGQIRAARTKGGHRRFRPEDVEALRLKLRIGAKHAAARRRASPPQVLPPKRRITASQRHVREPVVYYDDDEPDESFDDQEEREELLGHLHSAPPRPVDTLSSRPPRRNDLAEKPMATNEDAQRLNRIKAHGVGSIPYGVPGKWRGKVIEDLETFVTARRFPEWVSQWEAERIVRGRVEEVLKPWREEAALQKDAEERQARVRSLINGGMSYCRLETITDWDFAPALEARKEVEERLTAEVKPNWTELQVESAWTKSSRSGKTTTMRTRKMTNTTTEQPGQT